VFCVLLTSAIRNRSVYFAATFLHFASACEWRQIWIGSRTKSATGYPLGLLLNFGALRFFDGVVRRVNNFPHGTPPYRQK